MDVVKIGKFIAKKRKEKNMTQEQLAEKLGVTSKTISRWENGNYMPDISLLKPISEELGITLNDLLSGEKVEKEEYQEKSEENIINTLEYSNKKINEKNNVIGILIIIFGIICSITAMSIFPSESSWGSIYSVLGGIIALFGISKITHKLKYWKRLVICVTYLVLYMSLLIIIDFIGVVNIHQAPRFSTVKVTIDNIIYYDTPFYDVIRYNPGKENEEFEIIKNQKYDDEIIMNYSEQYNKNKEN